MRRDEAVGILIAHRAEWASYGIRSLDLFGSVARGEAGPGSDVDILVAFAPGERVGLFRFLRLKETLERLLGRPVDLVTRDAIKPRMRAAILQELVHVP
ncbi:MAG: nucleotidyltransferase family protein [Deltaproteobacteria bacterium]|nr:nucleotidyltransferase family protein [Deltaproteobacteria bacterium]